MNSEDTKNKSRGLPPELDNEHDNTVKLMTQKKGTHTRVVSSRALFFPAIILCTYLFFWFAPEVQLSNPWEEAIQQVNAAANSSDTLVKRQILEKAGARLKELRRIHPYHARVQYYLGCYFNCVGLYDSAIAQCKEAIRLGSGAILNRVDIPAQGLLVIATLRKAQSFIDQKDYPRAQALLRDAYAIAPDNIPLLKAIAVVFLASHSPDSATRYFERVAALDPKNDDALYNLGRIAYTRKRTGDATAYLKKALLMNPMRTDARQLLLLMDTVPENRPYPLTTP